jgi:hypothetical protein
LVGNKRGSSLCTDLLALRRSFATQQSALCLFTQAPFHSTGQQQVQPHLLSCAYAVVATCWLALCCMLRQLTSEPASNKHYPFFGEKLCRMTCCAAASRLARLACYVWFCVLFCVRVARRCGRKLC